MSDAVITTEVCMCMPLLPTPPNNVNAAWYNNNNNNNSYDLEVAFPTMIDTLTPTPLYRFSVHHQESSTVYTAIGTYHRGFADCLLAGLGSR
jgi:hypothetical protein